MVQIDPGPIPTFTAATPAATRSTAPSWVPTLPAMTSRSGKRLRTASTVVSGATSWSSSPSFVTSMTAMSVTMRFTHRCPVSGSVQCSRILGVPSLAACSMVTTTRLAPETRSMAPPIPFTILPGIIQLARLPSRSTCSAPRIVKSTWPPRTIAKESALEK